MIPYILIIAISLCIFQIISEIKKMNKIEKRYKETKFHQNDQK